MKTMKKIFALALALMLVFSLALTANAADLEIDGALKGAKYELYQMATVEQNETTGSILYYSTDAWKSFWNTAGATWFNYDAATGLITIKEGITEANMPAAAKAAKAYAEENTSTISAQATATADKVENPEVKIAADTGYYLMTSDKGSLCTLATITNDITIDEKNESLPRIEKSVSDANVAIGDTVTFTLTVTTGENHNNEMKYVIHDTMSKGLTLDEKSIVVKHGTTVLTKGTDYTVETGCADGCAFEIIFKETLTTAAYDTITVTYDATVATDIDVSATNTAKIDLSEDTETVTTTQFTLNKTDGTNPLAGAKFKLYVGTVSGEGESATTTYTEIPVVFDEEKNIYRPAVGEEVGVEIEAGTATVKGLDPDLTYYVLETQAPTGYIQVNDYKVVSNGTVTVVNVKGDELPETGGMGTTLFYTVGGLMVAAAVVLLVSKKRMSAM